ncbi:hypothetical protein K488DRAFT_92585 [Vararia minispora EC-137]|uniref:Uncharacterized protein n=1 Tax=Vararia minispora EC-137 TaxID=1314806 RepID=A0ACB8Q3X6_9AGAM|nr:hypothetical protein K488DRAFT_92585 [Vararia minispora EC-137]
MSSRFYVKKQKPRAGSKANTGSTADPSQTPAELSNRAAELGRRRRGRPPSIKSKVHRDWLEDRRPAYQRAVQKSKKVTGDFLSSTTTAFLDEFGWTSTHFMSYTGEEEEGSREGSDADAEDDEEQRVAIYKLARQKVSNFFWHSGGTNRATQQSSAESESLLQSLLSQAKPVRRPKLVNVFCRSPHYTPEMWAEWKRRWKLTSGGEHGEAFYDAEGGIDNSMDDEGCDEV